MDGADADTMTKAAGSRRHHENGAAGPGFPVELKAITDMVWSPTLGDGTSTCANVSPAVTTNENLFGHRTHTTHTSTGGY